MSEFELQANTQIFADNTNKLGSVPEAEINTMANIASELWQQNRQDGFSGEVTRVALELRGRDVNQEKVEAALRGSADHLAGTNRVYKEAVAADHPQRQIYVGALKRFFNMPTASADQILSMDSTQIYSALVKKYQVGSPRTDHKALYERLMKP